MKPAAKRWTVPPARWQEETLTEVPELVLHRALPLGACFLSSFHDDPFAVRPAGRRGPMGLEQESPRALEGGPAGLQLPNATRSDRKGPCGNIFLCMIL